MAGFNSTAHRFKNMRAPESNQNIKRLAMKGCSSKGNLLNFY